MNDQWRYILSIVGAAAVSIGGTVATQSGRVAQKVDKEVEAEIEKQVRMMVRFEQMEKDISGLLTRIARMETNEALKTYAEAR